MKSPDLPTYIYTYLKAVMDFIYQSKPELGDRAGSLKLVSRFGEQVQTFVEGSPEMKRRWVSEGGSGVER